IFIEDNDTGAMAGFVTGTVRFVGMDGVEVVSTMTLRYNNFGFSIEETFTVGGESVTLSFSETEVAFGGDPFIQVVAEDTVIDLGGFVQVGAESISFTRSFGLFVVSVVNGHAFVGEGGTGLRLENLNLALLLYTDIEGGSFALVADGFASVEGIPALTLQGNLHLLVNFTSELTHDFGGDLGSFTFAGMDDFLFFGGENILFQIDGFAEFSGDIEGGEVDWNLYQPEAEPGEHRALRISAA
ncbi:hypothetical protein, partial [Limnospira sp. Paracas R14]|uniref:hypothetical protein n=1 Tax=Limnospira sp. Paracas R14 TaxID=2981108 RepID=UPI0028E0A8CC|nr:hypothetical protein [Limnospira sp. Paracas R14]